MGEGELTVAVTDAGPSGSKLGGNFLIKAARRRLPVCTLAWIAGCEMCMQMAVYKNSMPTPTLSPRPRRSPLRAMIGMEKLSSMRRGSNLWSVGSDIRAEAYRYMRPTPTDTEGQVYIFAMFSAKFRAGVSVKLFLGSQQLKGGWTRLGQTPTTLTLVVPHHLAQIQERVQLQWPVRLVRNWGDHANTERVCQVAAERVHPVAHAQTADLEPSHRVWSAEEGAVWEVRLAFALPEWVEDGREGRDGDELVSVVRLTEMETEGTLGSSKEERIGAMDCEYSTHDIGAGEDWPRRLALRRRLEEVSQLGASR